MKFTEVTPCSCGGKIKFAAYGDADFKPATCECCRMPAHLTGSLSVSVVAERLLRRSDAELAAGDYTLAIIMSVMAIESYLTQLYMKLNKMEHFKEQAKLPISEFKWPTAEEESEWKRKYPKRGGFVCPAHFVTQQFAGKDFNSFVETDAEAARSFSALPGIAGRKATEYIHEELFDRRNKIMHWGYVNSSHSEAKLCHDIATGAVSILWRIDKLRYDGL